MVSFGLLVVGGLLGMAVGTILNDDASNQDTAFESNSIRIPTTSGSVDIDVFIMSKCPDAKDCVEQLIAPAMTALDFSPKINLNFEYIGRSVSLPPRPEKHLLTLPAKPPTAA